MIKNKICFKWLHIYVQTSYENLARFKNNKVTFTLDL